MAVHGDHHALHRHPQTAGGRLDDPVVGLMRNEPVDVPARESVRLQGLVHDPPQRPHRPLEHLVALHPGSGRALGGVVVAVLDAPLHVEEPLTRPVRVEMGRHHPRLRRALEHDRSRAVPEQDAGAAVAPVEEARMHVRADHESAGRAPGANELLRDPERVDEAGAHRLHVERGASLGSEASLQPARGGRVDPVRGGGPDHDEVEIGPFEARRLEGPPRRPFREVAGRLPGGRDAPFPDAGPFPDPLVGGVDGGGELVVGEHPLGKVAAGAGDAGEGHTLCSSERRPSRWAAMRAGTLFSTSTTASRMAFANECASARPWLLTTVPRNPTKTAPL